MRRRDVWRHASFSGADAVDTIVTANRVNWIPTLRAFGGPEGMGFHE
jgi:hypothetical protein